jgi:acyl dehydratase
MAIVTKSTEVGFELPPISNQMLLEQWIEREDYQQKGNPGFHGATNIHTDVEAAKLEGLKAPVAGGPLLLSQLGRMMMFAFGEGWIKGGKMCAKIIRPAYDGDFVTAKGIVREKIPEGSGFRYICEIWLEKQSGEKAIVGTASGVVR